MRRAYICLEIWMSWRWLLKSHLSAGSAYTVYGPPPLYCRESRFWREFEREQKRFRNTEWRGTGKTNFFCRFWNGAMWELLNSCRHRRAKCIKMIMPSDISHQQMVKITHPDHTRILRYILLILHSREIKRVSNWTNAVLKNLSLQFHCEKLLKSLCLKFLAWYISGAPWGSLVGREVCGSTHISACF